jgi:hypothetical protein
MSTNLIRPSAKTGFVRDSERVSHVSEAGLRFPYEELKKRGRVLREPRTDGKFWFPVPESRARRDKVFANLSFPSVVMAFGGSKVLIELAGPSAAAGDNMFSTLAAVLMTVAMPLVIPGMFYYAFGTADQHVDKLGLRSWFLSHGVRISNDAANKLKGKLRSSKFAVVTVVDNDGLKHVVHKEKMVDGVPVFSLEPDPAVAAPAAKNITATAAATTVIPFGVPKGVLSEEAMEVVSRIQVLGERLTGLSLSVDAAHVVGRAEADVQELVGIRSRMIKLDPEAVEGTAVLGTLLRIEAELKGVVADCVEGLDRELRIQHTYVVNR